MQLVANVGMSHGFFSGNNEGILIGGLNFNQIPYTVPERKKLCVQWKFHEFKFSQLRKKYIWRVASFGMSYGLFLRYNVGTLISVPNLSHINRSEIKKL